DDRRTCGGAVDRHLVGNDLGQRRGELDVERRDGDRVGRRVAGSLRLRQRAAQRAVVGRGGTRGYVGVVVSIDGEGVGRGGRRGDEDDQRRHGAEHRVAGGGRRGAGGRNARGVPRRTPRRADLFAPSRSSARCDQWCLCLGTVITTVGAAAAPTTAASSTSPRS